MPLEYLVKFSVVAKSRGGFRNFDDVLMIKRNEKLNKERDKTSHSSQSPKEKIEKLDAASEWKSQLR